MTSGGASGPTVGIVGGGQLGRMMALAARQLGLGCVVLEPGDDPPAAAVAEVVRGAYDDIAALEELAGRCDVLTVELEEVGTDELGLVSKRTGVPVHPSPAIVATTQDRLREKAAVRALGLPTAPYVELTDEASMGAVGWPAVVKLRRGGFDGRGQVVVRGPEDVAEAWAWVGGRPCVVEGWVPFRREVSVLAARSTTGEVAVWPAVENVHVEGQLARSSAPADTPGAEVLVRTLLEGLGYVGVLAVELFDTAEGLVVNELAPRVHNTGHWTIEGSTTSQFEQHLRAVLGLPLGSTAMAGGGAARMVNLLGDLPPLAALLAVPGAHVHRYGKAPRPGRKLGHVTLVGPDGPELAARAAQLEAVVGDRA